jgi:rhamnosyltransferase
MKAVIILATFNGAAYLVEQLRSIQAQSHKDFSVLIRDDGSTDGSIDIIEQFVNQDRRFLLIEDGVDRFEERCASDNFAALMSAAIKYPASGYFFCDQDDIWDQDKLEKTLEVICAAGNSLPLAVASQYEVKYEEKAQNKGAFKTQAVLKKISYSSVADACSRNIYPGCTLAFNRLMLELAVPVPEQVIIHDWWVVLLASIFGRLVEIEQPLMTYRIHSKNVIGVAGNYAMISQALSLHSSVAELESTFAQAESALARVENQGYADSDLTRRLLQVGRYARLRQAKWRNVLHEVSALKIRSNGLPLKCAFLLHLFLARRSTYTRGQRAASG